DVIEPVREPHVIGFLHEVIGAARDPARRGLVALAARLRGVALGFDDVAEHTLERSDALDARPESLARGRGHPLAADSQAAVLAARRAHHRVEALYAELVLLRLGRLHGRPEPELDVALFEDAAHSRSVTTSAAPGGVQDYRYDFSELRDRGDSQRR